MTHRRESSAVTRFSMAARSFCAWAEAKPGRPAPELRKGLELLSELYAAATKLPPNAKLGSGADDFALPLAAWKKVYRRFAALPVGKYSEIFDPSEVPAHEVVAGDVADDLADVYRDLIQGVRLEAAGRPRDALWQWLMNFHIHWGRHAVSALRALHCAAEVSDDWPAA